MKQFYSAINSGAVRWTALALVVLYAVSAFAQTTVKDGELKFELPDLEGKVVTHKDERFKGKVVLVDIWGTWCPPCREEIPFLVKMDEKYREKGLEIVGASFEKEGSNAEKVAHLKRYAEENKIKYTLLLGGSTAAVRKSFPDLQSFQGFPTTILIDRKGRVRKIEIGFSNDGAQNMENTITRLLDETEEKP